MILQRGSVFKVALIFQSRGSYLQGCHLMTEVVNTVQSEEARQALVQVVEYHRSMIKGFKKEELDKC